VRAVRPAVVLVFLLTAGFASAAVPPPEQEELPIDVIYLQYTELDVAFWAAMPLRSSRGRVIADEATLSIVVVDHREVIERIRAVLAKMDSHNRRLFGHWEARRLRRRLEPGRTP